MAALIKPNDFHYAFLDDSGAEGFSAMGLFGVIVAGVGAVLVLLNLALSVLLKKGKEADADPWSAQTPEWLLESPPPLGALTAGRRPDPTPVPAARDRPRRRQAAAA